MEGSEEQGTGGLEDYVPKHADLLRADAILVCDTGNAEVGEPAVTVSLRGLANVVVSVQALSSEVHSGMYGGPAPDALAALIHLLATLRDDAGNTTITGWTTPRPGTGRPGHRNGSEPTPACFPGSPCSGTAPSRTWSGPARRSPCSASTARRWSGSAAAIQPHAKARLNLRVPPGMDPVQAQDALVAHLEAAAPWGVRVAVERESSGEPFQARTGGPAYAALAAAMEQAYGRQLSTLGQGGSIPLCNVLADTYPDAEIILMGVEEPLTLMHAPNESVHPGEIAAMALTEALFLQHFAARRSG